MKKKNVQKIAITFVLTMAMVLGPLPFPGFSLEVKEGFQSIGSGECPISPATDWKNKTKEDYDR